VEVDNAGGMLDQKVRMEIASENDASMIRVPPARTTPAAREDFLALLAGSLAQGRFVKLVLARYKGAEEKLDQLVLRQVMLRDVPCLSLVYRYPTRDVTKNLPAEEGLKVIDKLLGSDFRNAHLLTNTEDIQLSISQRGQCTLRRSAGAHGEAAPQPQPKPQPHDREKQRFVELDRPFLAALGVTDAQHRLIPAMARKWKQINKFVEVFSHALAASPLAQASEIRVADFGSGKGYLTFAVHDHLRYTLKLNAQVTGVELRQDMVTLCNGVVAALGIEGLAFEQGDIGRHAPQAIDVMIALHACDTATDHAIHKGIRAGAAIILCSPCCHKQVRPQLLSPHPLRPILQHGIHLGQEAEMLTDGLRALLLESRGYQTQVFEFISLEHTHKNKMILAVKRAAPGPAVEVLAQIDEIKRFYGIREQCLETLLNADA
jgi:Methyltransferase domain